MNISTLMLNALLKELETNPERVFTLFQSIIDLFKQHPEALIAAIQAVAHKTS